MSITVSGLNIFAKSVCVSFARADYKYVCVFV